MAKTEKLYINRKCGNVVEGDSFDKGKVELEVSDENIVTAAVSWDSSVNRYQSTFTGIRPGEATINTILYDSGGCVAKKLDNNLKVTVKSSIKIDNEEYNPVYRDLVTDDDYQDTQSGNMKIIPRDLYQAYSYTDGYSDFIYTHPLFIKSDSDLSLGATGYTFNKSEYRISYTHTDSDGNSDIEINNNTGHSDLFPIREGGVSPSAIIGLYSDMDDDTSNTTINKRNGLIKDYSFNGSDLIFRVPIVDNRFYKFSLHTLITNDTVAIIEKTGSQEKLVDFVALKDILDNGSSYPNNIKYLGSRPRLEIHGLGYRGTPNIFYCNQIILVGYVRNEVSGTWKLV